MIQDGPVLLVGCGRLGSAMLKGWRRTGAVDPRRLMIRTPSPKPEADAAAAEGATINPDPERLAAASAVVLAVKPARWREAAAELAPHLADEAVVISVMAGVRAADVAAGFGGRAAARVMPTTGVAAGRGVASIYSAEPDARAAAHALFDPMAETVDLVDEALMDAATAVSASAPAYVYAFLLALGRAGEAAGLPAQTAARLARATLVSAAAHLDDSGEDPQALIAQVASPGGTTEAALNVLQGGDGLDPLLRDAVAAAVRRAGELSR